jgi:sigma-B regulation protein RsbU (phosphoserine phosphatase)
LGEFVTVSESVRLAALAELDMVGSDPEERFDRVTRIAKELFNVPIAEINFIDRDSQYTKSPQKPGGSTPTPRADSFCDVVVQQADILVVEDALNDPRFAGRGTVTGEPHIRFYAGRPLSVAEGVRVGTICLVDTAPRELSDEEADLLGELGEWVERELRGVTAVRGRAATVQQQMLPAPLHAGGGFTFAGFSRAYEDAAGDYFAWDADPELNIVHATVTDVMGKGPAAAIIAAAIRSAFQARPLMAPAEAVAAVNAQLLRDLSATGSFATLFHARVDTATGSVRYADAGHGLSLIVRRNGTLERLAGTDLPIGIMANTLWDSHDTSLDHGDALLSCSDGALELFDGSLEALNRLAELAREHPDDESFFSALSSLIDSSAPEDDVTIMLVRRN